MLLFSQGPNPGRYEGNNYNLCRKYTTGFLKRSMDAAFRYAN